jgi:hypothetical protein
MAWTPFRAEINADDAASLNPRRLPVSLASTFDLMQIPGFDLTRFARVTRVTHWFDRRVDAHREG